MSADDDEAPLDQHDDTGGYLDDEDEEVGLGLDLDLELSGGGGGGRGKTRGAQGPAKAANKAAAAASAATPEAAAAQPPTGMFLTLTQMQALQTGRTAEEANQTPAAFHHSQLATNKHRAAAARPAPAAAPAPPSLAPPTPTQPPPTNIHEIAATAATAVAAVPPAEPAPQMPTTLQEAAARIHHLAKRSRELQAKANAEQAKNNKLTAKVSCWRSSRMQGNFCFFLGLFMNHNPCISLQIGELEYKILQLEREVSKRKRQEFKLQAQINELSGKTPASTENTSGHNSQKPGDTIGAHHLSADPEAPVSAADVAKIHEYRSEVQQLKQQLRVAHKALEREVGDSTPLARVLASDSGWQGRAEQLTMLKIKLAEAQAQLKAATGKSQAPSLAASINSTRRGSVDVDPRAKENLKRLEKERRGQLEEVSGRLDTYLLNVDVWNQRHCSQW